MSVHGAREKEKGGVGAQVFWGPGSHAVLVHQTHQKHKTVRETTSEVKTLSYIDDTVLVGPADDIAEVIQKLPRAIGDTGLSLQPQKTQLWAPQSDQITQHPSLKLMQTQMKDPRGLIILGEALGEDPTDPYPMGNEAFIQDHLRDVTAAVANDLRKIAILPDKLEGDTAGLQVAWARFLKNFTTPGGTSSESPPGGANTRNVRHYCKTPS